MSVCKHAIRLPLLSTCISLHKQKHA